ncbi:MAG: ABC transporter permease [Actinomycetia bacterium]|nr:ABC transporter permease [Actinomycetes bacterium]MCP4226321.1 ABC transporter permease [Actinomycetes bacterium]MCP5032435.1 ABC transporter permease [Actinomycetes bacterium]
MLEQSPSATTDGPEPPAQVDLEALLDEGVSGGDESVYQTKKLGLFFWLAAAWLVSLVLSAIFADFLPLKDPDATFAGTFRQGPSAEHWFGSDNIGKDVFSRTIYGARKSLGTAFTASLIGFVVGGSIGLLAGYYRKRIEGILTGGIDILLAFPALILALILALFLGETELPVLKQIAGSPTKALIIALGILSIPTIARITRAGVLVNTEREYVLAARTLGARNLRIMIREVLPNVLPAMLAFSLIGVSFLIIIEAALAFLGVGDLTKASWGVMISFGRDRLKEAPHAVFFPALFMFLTVLSVNFIGDRLRQYFDVRDSAL